MKKTVLSIIAVLSLMFFVNEKVLASHYMGGEITWECISGGSNNGKYIFTLKAYRECAGITYGTSQTINSTSPAGSISCSIKSGWPKDISPTCNTNPSFPHITCATATVSNAGAVSEYIWISQPVTLNGVPPATGWMFYWGSCCRNPSANINGQPSWRLRAMMYPYGTQNMYPCFDNSPTFAEIPRTVICTGYPFTYNHNAFDKELDSLHYEWGQPLQSSGAPLTYTGTYSYLSPLPGTAQNSNNVPGTVNPVTGEISFTSYTTGAYVTSTKVTAYKCGVKVAEIWRDMQVVLLACGTNSPPNVTPPFNSGTSFVDTIYAGDNICFSLSATDFQFLPNGSPQTLSIHASGMQLGSFIPPSGTNPATLSGTSGCVNPPCATLTPAPGPGYPLSAQFGVQTQFCWQTDCGHLATNTGCGNTSNVYNFVIKVADDFCPAPAINISTVTVVVLPKPTLPSPSIQCVKVQSNGDVGLTWTPVVDTMATFDSYRIYHSSTYGGTYTLLDTIADINIANYTHVGAGANTQTQYYYVLTRAGCPHHQLNSVSPDTAATMHMNVANPLNGTAVLSWNPIHNPLLSSSSQYYYIYREYPVGTWVMIDSTMNTSYIDTVTLCGDTLNYQVTIADTMLFDTAGTQYSCNSISSMDNDYFMDANSPSIPNIDSVSVNPLTGNVDIAWDENSWGDCQGYIIYIYSGGSWTPIDTVWGKSNITYSDALNNACIPGSYNSYKVAAIDSCGLTSPMSIEHNTMNLVAIKDICDDKITLKWNSYNNFISGLAGYKIYVSENGGPITLLGTKTPSDTSFEHLGLNNGSQYCYMIQANDNSGTRSSSSCVICQVANKPNQPQFIYVRTATVFAANDGVFLLIHTDTTAKVMEYKIERSDDNSTWTQLGTLPPNYSNPTQTYTDGSALVTEKDYYYRVIVKDSCGVDVLTSPVAKTMLLNVEPQNDLKNVLQWTPYEGFLGQPNTYAIYRKVDGVLDPLPIATVPAAQNNYIDDVEGLSNSSGIFHYYVMALEGNGNQYGFQDSSRSNTMMALQKPRVYVPTAFRPSSSDPKNKTFYPTGVFIASDDYLFQVYNRWGQLLFESTKVNEGWDGTYQGKEAEQGVYTFYIRFTTSDGQLFEKRGTTTLIR